jgi:hypothetical protein
LAGIFAATITVSSAGTAVQVTTTPTPFVWAIFHNAPGNSGNVYIGDADVASTNGLSLQRITGVDAATNGDKIEVLAKVL